jgi:hypothetical protein
MIVRLGVRDDGRNDVTVRLGAERRLGVCWHGVAGPAAWVDLRRLLRGHAFARDSIRRYFAERYRFLLVEQRLFESRVLDQSRPRQRQEE